MKYLLTLTVAFLALGGFAVLFFTAADKTQAQPLQTSPYSITGQAGLASSSSSLAPASSYRALISLLDNDQNHDGNYDRMADPLAGLAFSPAVVVIVLGLVGLGGVRLLLVLNKAQKLSSTWLTAWEECPG